MAPLEGRRWYSASLVLALSAILAQVVAKYHAGRGMVEMARATAIIAERPRLCEVAYWHARRSDSWGIISLGLVLAMAFCWVLIHRDRRPGPRGVLWALVAVYVVLAWIIV